MNNEITLPRRTVICAAKTYAAAHESACTGKPVDWGGVCAGCSEMMECKADWVKAAAPLFDAADIHPQTFRPQPLR